MVFSRRFKIKTIIAGLFLMLFSFGLQSAIAAEMSDYCITPPYIGASLEPNLLLFIDNSASMYDAAFQKPSSYCFDDTYNNAGTYDGYFTQNATYCYSTANGAYNTLCTYSPGYNEFDGGGTYSYMPATCTYGGSSSTTPFVCVNTGTVNQVDPITGNTVQKEIVTQFVASGKFLNWLAMSKFDIEKKILTGGKYDPSYGDLVAETRGCAGRKFIKSVAGLPLTFAMRGGRNPLEITNQAMAYGQAYIEVYKGTYNSTACLAAVNDWTYITDTQQGQLQTDTKQCVGGSGKTPDAIAAYEQVVHDCYWFYVNHSLSNVNALETACGNDYKHYPNGPADITANAPDAICGGTADNWFPHQPWNGNEKGFLGLCVQYDPAHPNQATWDDACAARENEDFCAGLSAAPATDPPSTVLTGTTVNVPGWVMEAGLYSMPMLNDYKSYGGETGFRVEVYDPWHVSPWPPTGIIDKYKNQIRFGALTFQNNGSASECGNSDNGVPCSKVCSNTPTQTCFRDSDCSSGEICKDLTPTDGGVIISYVGAGQCSDHPTTACTVDSDCNVASGEYCKPDVGSHTSGLIKSIDDIKASSWTPFAEAFYNAMGYFARSNDYTATPPSSRNFNFTGSPGSFDASGKNPSQKRCQKNAILLLTDGMSTADQNAQSENLASLYASDAGLAGKSGYDTTNSCPAYAGSRSLPILTWIAHNRNIKNFSLTNPLQKHCSDDIFGSTCTNDSDCTAGTCTNSPINSSEGISTYVVYSGPQTSDPTKGLCDPKTLMTTAALKGGTQLYQATDVTQLQTALENAFDQVAAKAASGTAASVLASGQGTGANLIQAVFYPHKKFPNSVTGIDDEISWIGKLTNLWYYIDPLLANSNIREDDGDKILNLKTDATHHDNIVQMYYVSDPNDINKGLTLAKRWTDPTGSGVISSANLLSPDVFFENLKNVWEAGTMLWKQAPGTRHIKTTTGSGLIDFDIAHAATLTSYLQAPDVATAEKLISWVTGSDIKDANGNPIYRSRTVKIETIDSTPRVWKLGDIVNSTAKTVSWTPLNAYHRVYKDSSYGNPGFNPSLDDPADPNHFITTTQYKSRGMVFAGGNDGMLHAFKLGTVQLKWDGQLASEKARLVSSPTDTVPFGQEVWSFIPKNALPYLKYMADPSYCHVYSVDLAPVIFDASIGAPGSNAGPNDTKTPSSWRTVLIGGMRLGGACRNNTAPACTDCVRTPISNVGFSSYFALDITDPNNPILMWEFSNDNLGFATTGPAIVRIQGQIPGTTGQLVPDSNNTKNGNWFVIFGSGPTGPISTTDRQFMGRSDQDIRLFILDLKTGTVLRTMHDEINIQNGFVGSLSSDALDADGLDYQDEAFYVPYINKDDTTWTLGGVGRVLTKRDPNPNNWSWSTLMDGVGPITAAVSKLVDKSNNNLWIYFGTGRYYYVTSSGAVDDATGQRHLIAVKDPCYLSTGFDNSCTSSVGFSSLTDVTDIRDVPSASDANGTGITGLKIALEPDGTYTYSGEAATNFMAERDITDPLASSTGCIYFTTYKPYTDQCLLGGKTFVWSLQYNTFGICANQGHILLQTSTGALGTPPPPTGDDGRRSGATEGTPPPPPPTIQGNPKAVKRTVHIRER